MDMLSAALCGTVRTSTADLGYESVPFLSLCSCFDSKYNEGPMFAGGIWPGFLRARWTAAYPTKKTVINVKIGQLLVKLLERIMLSHRGTMATLVSIT